jgi:hypothetical protein
MRSQKQSARRLPSSKMNDARSGSGSSISSAACRTGGGGGEGWTKTTRLKLLRVVMAMLVVVAMTTTTRLLLHVPPPPNEDLSSFSFSSSSSSLSSRVDNRFQRKKNQRTLNQSLRRNSSQSPLKGESKHLPQTMRHTNKSSYMLLSSSSSSSHNLLSNTTPQSAGVTISSARATTTTTNTTSTRSTTTTIKKQIQGHSGYQRPEPVDVRIELSSDMKTVVLQTRRAKPETPSNINTTTTTTANSITTWTNLLPSSGQSRLYDRQRYTSPYQLVDPLWQALQQLPSSPAINGTTTSDKQEQQQQHPRSPFPIRATTAQLQQQQPPLPFYLGVLIDAGRHYFPMKWLKQLVQYLALMRYNYIHFRLTDDQSFNVQLQSHPELAFPSVVNGNTQVYTPHQLRELVQFAKQYNITIIPELNVPGHAGAWGGGGGGRLPIPNLVVQCPQFTCAAGNGMPLNISHPLLLSTILPNVLHEIIDIFDHPPFLHLGGDEVDLGEPCWVEYENQQRLQTRQERQRKLQRELQEQRLQEQEHQHQQPSTTKTNDANANDANSSPTPSPTASPTLSRKGAMQVFESQLELILANLGYTTDQIIRWERRDNTDYRAGSITQYWESLPEEGSEKSNTTGTEGDNFQDNGRPATPSPQRWMASTGLYFDIKNNHDAWDYYQQIQTILGHPAAASTSTIATPTGSSSFTSSSLLAIVAGTFELDTEYWLDRNVMGRLLAVAMAVQGAKASEPPFSSREDLEVAYEESCIEKLQWDPSICDLFGQPTLDQWSFSAKWYDSWHQWKSGICHRLTEEVSRKWISTSPLASLSLTNSNVGFWERFGRTKQYLPATGTNINTPTTTLRQSGSIQEKTGSDTITTTNDTTWLPKDLQHHAVPHTGVILDLVNGIVPPLRVQKLLQETMLSRVGFNLIQLRLANDDGFVMTLPSVPFLGYVPGTPEYSNSRVEPYAKRDLVQIVRTARRHGIQVFPEISSTTNAGGWYKGGFLANCPTLLCQSGDSNTGGRIRNSDRADTDPPRLVGVVSHNITNFSLLPVIASVVRDLRRIFSSDYLHLGSDERLQGMNCFRERRTGLDVRLDDFARFERKLSALLTLEGVPLDRVLRWENQEHTRYEDRTGRMTHFVYYADEDMDENMDASRRRNWPLPPPQKRTGTPADNFFVALHLVAKNPWTVYQATRELVRHSPTAILAEVKYLSEEHWEETRMAMRLLAFAMGVATHDEMDRETFEKTYVQLCVQLDISQCHEGVLPSDWPVSAKNVADVELACTERTREFRIRIPRVTNSSN